MLRGVARELLCSKTTIIPELSAEGAVIVLDLPIKEFDEVGLFVQVLFKTIWQRAMERRNPTDTTRPVFLWCDESLYFITSQDAKFQTTARSSRVSTVYLTQNLPNYYESVPGDKGRHAIDALLGNLQTKIFHQNDCIVTNQWAADYFARDWRRHSTTQISQMDQDPFSLDPQQNQSNTSFGTSESFDYAVLPRDFKTLRKGGMEHGLCVDAIIGQGGRVWQATRSRYLTTTFSQNH